MATKLEKELEEIRAEIARQDEEWARAEGQLAHLAGFELRISESFFEELEMASRAPATEFNHIVGLRA